MLYDKYLQTVTYWAAPVPNGTGGYTFSAPTSLAARWEDRIEQVSNPQGDVLTARSTVFVKQDVSVGGYLYLGTSVATDPTTVAGAQEVIAFIKVPDIRNMNHERRAMCR